jgi:hypothetical protein
MCVFYVLEIPLPNFVPPDSSAPVTTAARAHAGILYFEKLPDISCGF